ncbi:MAG: di-trans,poly-cis-decaprenylcistransferase [Holosporales bacterium]|jgi:undecaprenyl diphosphate synthase|nr:di-trans,poly-cis-decaprenylcistransferase [Holosporales bacterium]
MLRDLNHIGFIMDGNATWALARSVPPMSGYAAGMKAASNIVVAAKDFGIEYLTFYVFSSENWGRPKPWISDFMDLVIKFLKNGEDIRKVLDAGARVRIIGDRERLSSELQKTIEAYEVMTKDNSAIFVQLAVSYGGRDEIVSAAKKIAASGLEFTEESISAHLDTGGIPDPQLVIRTSNKHRLSNFLPWQTTYSELYFPDVLWPDFDAAELDKAIQEFARRKRTYGK